MTAVTGQTRTGAPGAASAARARCSRAARHVWRNARAPQPEERHDEAARTDANFMATSRRPDRAPPPPPCARSSYPRGPADIQVLHHFLEGRRLLRLLLGVQRDLLAEFSRIVRGRHLSPLLLKGMSRYAARAGLTVTSSRTLSWRVVIG